MWHFKYHSHSQSICGATKKVNVNGMFKVQTNAIRDRLKLKLAVLIKAMNFWDLQNMTV